MTRKILRNAAGAPVTAIADLAFAVAAGETAALIGPSGCGKSTLMRILAGLDRRYEGELRLPPSARIGMVFQEPRLLPWRTVGDNVRLAAPGAGEPRIAALFAALGLAEHRQHFPGELSLGLARRVALARAFAVEPTLLLLDEPFVSLDAPLALRLQRDLARLIEAAEATTVLVTHDAAEAARLADVVFLLSPRPARVIGEARLPRAERGPDTERALVAKIEALRGGG